MAISLIAVGDISFGDSPKCLGFGVRSKIKTRGGDFIFEKIKDHLDADILFGNLETILSDEGLIPYDFESEQMRGPVECIEVLSRVGFNVLNIANNHILQHGEKAFYDCIERLKKRNIKIVGLRGKDKYYSEPAIIDVKNKQIGILGYSFEEDNLLGGFSDRGYVACVDPEIVCSDVMELAKSVDFIIISLHWGLEFAVSPSIYLKEIARSIIDSGASIILGHHPHVLQCFDEYNDKVICYSLGNFVFDMKWNKLCTQSVIANFKISSSAKIDNFKLSSVRINNNYQPELSNDCFSINSLKKLTKCRHKNASKQENVEKKNLEYYKMVHVQQLKDTFLSNLFLLFTLAKTPFKYLPGKLKYILKIFF